MQTRLTFRYHLRRLERKVTKIHKIISKRKIIISKLPSLSKTKVRHEPVQQARHSSQPQGISNSDSFKKRENRN